jgi:hypothetical protein
MVWPQNTRNRAGNGAGVLKIIFYPHWANKTKATNGISTLENPIFTPNVCNY